MNKCCEDRTTAYCPDCGSQLSSRPTDELLNYLKGVLARQEDLLTEAEERASALRAAHAIEDGSPATDSMRRHLKTAKDRTLRWRKRLSIAQEMAEVYGLCQRSLKDLSEMKEALLTEQAKGRGQRQGPSIPEEWVRDYVDQLLAVAASFQDGAMKASAALRAEHAMDLVTAHRAKESI
jgi:hypothetical protein